MSDDWLADVTIVNESQNEASAGNVQIFRSAGEACAYLEHWWVEEGHGFAFTAAGDRLTLGVERGSVTVISREIAPDGIELVLRWLLTAAASVLEARRAKARKRKAILAVFEEQGRLPTSIEGLIAYIGFES